MTETRGSPRVWSQRGQENVMSSAFCARFGEILLFYLVKNDWDDCHLYVRRSSDELITLGQRTCAILNGILVVNNDGYPTLQRQADRPATCIPAGRCTDFDHTDSDVFLSDDLERHARSQNTLQLPERIRITGARVIELADGADDVDAHNLVANTRLFTDSG